MRDEPDGEKDAVERQVIGFAGRRDLDADPRKFPYSEVSIHDRAKTDLDVFLRPQLVGKSLFAGQEVQILDHVDLFGEIRQKQGFLQRRIAAADHSDRAILIKGAVADRAERDAVADEIVLAGKS